MQARDGRRRTSDKWPAKIGLPRISYQRISFAGARFDGTRWQHLIFLQGTCDKLHWPTNYGLVEWNAGYAKEHMLPQCSQREWIGTNGSLRRKILLTRADGGGHPPRHRCPCLL